MDDLKAKFAAFDKKTLIKFGIGFGSCIGLIAFSILMDEID